MDPVDRCPIETFTNILQHVVHPTSQSDGPHNPTGWLRLLLVSRGWRDVVLSTKSFWSTIYVHGENGEKWLKLCLDRAHGASLEINIDFANIAQLDLTLLLHYASDIRSLALSSLLKKRLPAVNTFLASGTFSALEDLSARRDRENIPVLAPGEVPDVVHLALNRTAMPRLKTLQLYNLAYVADPSVLEHLEKLWLFLCWETGSSANFMETLPAMKRLKSLYVARFGAADLVQPPSHPITLPSLTCLEIPGSNTLDLTTILSHLHLPCATQVILNYITDGRIDAQGHEEDTGRNAGIGDVLPRPRTNVLPFLPLVTDVALAFERERCEFAVRTAGGPHCASVGYMPDTTGTLHEVPIDPGFQLRDLIDVARDCPAATRLDISAARRDFTCPADVWRALLGHFPLLTELRFEGHGSLASLWSALDPNGDGGGSAHGARDAVLCPALRTIALRDYTVTWNPWEEDDDDEDDEYDFRFATERLPRIELCVEACREMLAGRAARGVPLARFEYVAAPRTKELDEFETVYREDHAAMLAEHVPEVSIRTIHTEEEDTEMEDDEGET
ncbi:uncharacterized protein BXZ73DRAFT_108088 [Epithele typhae]|uniref:uncharacterized protein n=1 Tax=Epithele typhae TaxID=378194 RepID=UPI002007C62A|nr:uncharacterized protein BXZ73DRAFT_108088 [Epithele typhae]KAH9911323.1 hypothetical protein BXZ73DRAFT_108088 [Epithele typhae]